MVLRPAFTVSSGVLVALAVFAAFAARSRGRIPPRPVNALAASDDAFLLQARYQPVDWAPFGPAAFARAEREGKPVLVVLGAPWSLIARDLDRRVFSDPDLANYVNLRTVPTRLDGGERPDWLGAFLPLYRLQSGALAEFQLVVLTARGRLVALVAQSQGKEGLGRENLLRALFAARRTDEEWRERPGTAPDLQAEETLRLEAPADASPAAETLLAPLARAVQEGPVWRSGRSGPRPSLLRALAAGHRDDALAEAARRVVYGPLHDVLDGGFFHALVERGPYARSYDKLSVENAETAHALAVAGVELDRNDFALAAVRATDSLLAAAGRASGFPVCRIGDERSSGRSTRSSFSPARLRRLLPRDLLDFAQERLALRTDVNPEMTPYPRDAAAMTDPRADAVLARLRADASPAEWVLVRQLDVEATVVARLVDACRVRGDDLRLSRVLERAEDLRDYGSPDALSAQIPAVGTPPPARLADLLAFADAGLSIFLATGSVPALEDGRTALRRVAAFESAPGLYRLRLPAENGPVPESAMPGLGDDAGESAQARIVRLYDGYARLFGEEGDGPGFRRRADAAAERCAPLAALGGVDAAGLVAALVARADDASLFTVGPDAERAASRLARRFPARFVAPAVGPVRRALRGLAPGVYEVSRDGVFARDDLRGL